MMRCATIRRVQYYFRTKSLPRARVVVPTFTILAAGLYPYYCEDVREKRLRSAFDQGAVPSPAGFHVERKEVEAEVRRLLQPQGGYCCYNLIAGDWGTGKTSLVRHVGHECSGIIYVAVPVRAENFDKAFADAINWSPPIINWVKAIVSKITGSRGYTGSGGEFIEGVFREFERQAKEFQQKNNRPAVLVLDHIDYLAESDPARLREIQRIARQAADNQLFNTVFITNKSKAQSMLDRRDVGITLKIGDLTCDDALDYLQKYHNRSGIEAREIYQLIGGRILFLTKAVTDLKNGTALSAWKDLTLDRAGDAFREAKMLPGGANHTVGLNVARRILKSGPLAVGDYYRAVGCMELGDKLIASDVFSDQQPSGKITFHSKLVESYAKLKIAGKI